MPTLIESLIYDPDRYLHGLDGDHLAFRTMTRQTYGQSIFLDGRIVAADNVTTRAPLEPVLHGARHLPDPCYPLAFIFHIAHCGSTLLARALEREEANLVLREPLALRQLGVLAAEAYPDPPPAEWRGIAALVHRLLAKRYRPDAPVIVKANVPVNFMVPWLLDLTPDTPAIFLHLPLERYLLAVLRSDDHRTWVMQVTTDLFPALASIAEFADALDPARMAAALWLAQMRIYAEALERHPAARSLDADVLFARPGEVLTAAFDLFGTTVSRAEIDAITGGPLFTTHAKDPSRTYDEAERRRVQQDTQSRLAGEIADATRWLRTKLAAHPLPDALPRPLTGGLRPLFDAG